MNVTALFQTLRVLARTTETKVLSQLQVDGVNAILEACKDYPVTDLRFIAYILATAWHESRFKPVEEIGKGTGRAYGQKLDMGGGPGKRVHYTTPDKLYYGRGFVQLTWRVNYASFGRLLKLDLLNRPELAMQIDVAAQIIVMGMVRGLFTGKKLSDAFNAKESDPIEARGIVNGSDKATLIKGYYDKIYKALITQ